MSAHKVVVIDYGVGNLLSVRRGLEHCGGKVVVSNDPDEILAGDRVVLPGVGAFGDAMRDLTALHLVPAIHEIVQRGTPLLGICLGMQLLLDQSEEFGSHRGLGLIPGSVQAVSNRSATSEPLKIPHIGWSALLPPGAADWRGTLLADNRPGEAMYFVHSFAAIPSDHAHRLADCMYGGHLIPAVIAAGNVTGCQFHPEKSGDSGLKILRRFLM